MAARFQNGVDMFNWYNDMMRKRLNAQQGVGNANPYSMYRPNVNDPLGGSGRSYQPGALNLPYGVTPSELDLSKFIEIAGGNPFTEVGASAQPSGSSGGGANSGYLMGGPGAGANPLGNMDPLLGYFLQQLDQERQKANLVNDQRERNVDDIYRERERQADTELTALRDRAMGEVDNWGGVQAKLNQEQADSALARQKLMLAASGFDMSTHLPAFAGRIARDLALVNQDLSEKKSDRKVRYDSQLTGDLARTRAQLAGDRAAFQERPTDQGPSLESMLQLVSQYGRGNQGNGYFDGTNAGGQALANNVGAIAGRGGAPYLAGFAGVPNVDLFGLQGGNQQQAPADNQQQALQLAQLQAMQGGDAETAQSLLTRALQLAQLQAMQGAMSGPDANPMAGVPTPGMFRKQEKQMALQQRVAARRAAGYTKPRSTGQGRALRMTQGFRLF